MESIRCEGVLAPTLPLPRSLNAKVTPEGFEPPAFGFGIQRAAVAPWSHSLCIGWCHGPNC